MTELDLYKPAFVAAVLALLWTLEAVAPEFLERRQRASHSAHNLALGLLNAALLAIGFAAMLVAVAEWSSAAEFGLLHRFELPVWVKWTAAILLFDLWMYIWHRANHLVPVLWRFHSVHHSDAEMDASSAVRFHSIEIVLSVVARLLVVPLLGVTPLQLVAYEMILQPVILFHHSNVKMPPRLDRALRFIIVTPWMHRVHHSQYRPETDSNFSSVFSWWDRIFRSFRLRRDPGTIKLGLQGYSREEWRRLDGMLLSPFKSPRNGRKQRAQSKKT
ncbi:MAG: sterol desaturase family protein [Opitutales bacterium]